MSKVDEYSRKLSGLHDWIPYLRRESGLPGPRGNLELAEAVAELAGPDQVEALLTSTDAREPENTPGVFVLFCGVAAHGRLVARGDWTRISRLRGYASDARWRVREAVAIALQYIGDADMPALVKEMYTWVRGTWYERRAAAAALAEPRLLKSKPVIAEVLGLLDAMMADLSAAADARDDSFKACRQTLGYAWSVVVAAAPPIGKPAMEKWLRRQEPQVTWVMNQNLGKARLTRMDPTWVKKWKTRLASR